MFVFKNNNGSLSIRDKRPDPRSTIAIGTIGTIVDPNRLVVSFKNKMVRCLIWTTDYYSTKNV